MDLRLLFQVSLRCEYNEVIEFVVILSKYIGLNEDMYVMLISVDKDSPTAKNKSQHFKRPRFLEQE